MMRARPVALLALVLAVTISSVVAEPAGSATELASEGVLARAARLADLAAPGLPFRLTASVVVHGEYRGKRKGTYELIWLGPGEWTETWRLEGYERTRTTHDGVLTLACAPTCPPERAAWPVHLLAWARAPRRRVGDEVLRRKERPKKGLTCIVVAAALGVRREECVDADGVLRRIAIGSTLLDFEGDVHWQDRRHARRLVLRDGGHPAVEIEVTAIEAAPADATVEAPQGAPTWPGGPERLAPTLLAAPVTYPPMAAKFQRTGLVAVHGTVGVDGRASGVTVACSSGFESLDGQLLKAVERWRWAPATVAGRPVASPFDIEVDFRVE